MKTEYIENEIFSAYRENQNKVKKAIELLKQNNFVVYERRQKESK